MALHLQEADIRGPGGGRLAAAEALFQKRKQGKLVAIDQLDRYRSLASMLHQQAESHGHGVRYMATPIGVLVAEAAPGGLKHDEGCEEGKWFGYREVKTKSDDRALAALLSLHTFGGPYMAQEAERECRKVLKRGPTDVILFVDDPEHMMAKLGERNLRASAHSRVPYGLTPLFVPVRKPRRPAKIFGWRGVVVSRTAREKPARILPSLANQSALRQPIGTGEF